MNTSIIIPLGKGSKWNNTELRYCLRSVEKHLTGYGDVFIIGDKPAWLRNVIHIPFDEGPAPKTYEKEKNIFNKITAACGDDRVTDNFLFMNDDHFLLQDYEAGKFPYYCDGLLNDYKTVTDYKNTIWNTIDCLRPSGRDGLYFDIHCPIEYNKDKFQWCLSDLDWTKRFGYCIKTVYCNCVDDVTPTRCPDLKINEAYPADKIRDMLTGRTWFSIGDRAREGEMLQVLQELYPKKSIYEK
jgi:hypothetical protein